MRFFAAQRNGAFECRYRLTVIPRKDGGDAQMQRRKSMRGVHGQGPAASLDRLINAAQRELARGEMRIRVGMRLEPQRVLERRNSGGIFAAFRSRRAEDTVQACVGGPARDGPFGDGDGFRSIPGP